MNDPFEDMPPLFDPSDLTRYIEETFQLLDEMKKLGRSPPLGRSQTHIAKTQAISRFRITN